ncbi:DUF1874 domain-containing protein [Micromonospora fluostatini]|uniref:DUF1874 domain-containing protein n=1 Tax=Micromonospora fluostatini TaxID=1629071 RepID=A0ABY2DQB9_9ACTN|nr:DUF1874 domain-containing protein [Micromonospora fluostatini]
MSPLPIAILNTSIVTTDGDYTVREITLEEAIAIAHSSEIDSAVGHDATAALLTELLGVAVPVNRQMFAQRPGQKALVFKLNGRPAPGVELDLAGLEQVGYTFKLLTRTA